MGDELVSLDSAQKQHTLIGLAQEVGALTSYEMPMGDE